MFKAIISAVAISLSVAGCAGYSPATDEQRLVSKVVELPGASKEQIYQGAKVWLAETFVSAKAVIEHDSKEDGTIIGNGAFKWPCEGFECVGQSDWRMSTTIRIDIKDSKLKMTMSNIRKSWPAKSNYPAFDDQISLVTDFDTARRKLDELAISIASSINKNSTAKKDW